ncbi:MAG: 6-carboxytetrahydropterin synthase QueD [Vicinamibacteria bacterium]|nr:6-carboxytetrahydropterin synthase QueD [Vicinamibacteria bacterium]
MRIFKAFRFEAAHYLPNLPEGHKCGRVHGHSFRVEIHVDGPVDKHAGWVIDYAEIKKLFKPILERLDHRCLNEIGGLENPTSENIARWIWARLAPALPILTKIVVRESRDCGAVYSGTEPQAT